MSRREVQKWTSWCRSSRGASWSSVRAVVSDVASWWWSREVKQQTPTRPNYQFEFNIMKYKSSITNFALWLLVSHNLLEMTRKSHIVWRSSCCPRTAYHDQSSWCDITNMQTIECPKRKPKLSQGVVSNRNSVWGEQRERKLRTRSVGWIVCILCNLNFLLVWN